MNDKRTVLYHGSYRSAEGPLVPILRNGNADRAHTRAAVFATERADIAALFMLDPQKNLFSIGFEDDVAYICIWGSAQEFSQKSEAGFLYILPAELFEKIGKAYEWQRFEPVVPIEIKRFESAIDGMMEVGAQVYFIDDDSTMDRIVADKEHRAALLRTLISENERRGMNVKSFA